ncbi:MAG: aldo/keto reductase [Candidatus Thorarchaeota archaeon]|nr:aldo/keto reductase [Candidatus Thorarchaeota archaeon]
MRYQNVKGAKISEIGVGCYSISGAYGKKNINEFKQMLEHAIDLGITFFDTSDIYGDGEKVLGDVLKHHRDDVVISTKFGPKDGLKVEMSKEYIWKACDASLKNLQTDFIDFYQIHFDDPNVPVDIPISVLDDLVEDGMIGHYGISHLSYDRTLAYCKAGDISTMLIELSAATRTSRKKLSIADKYNIGTIGFSVTGRGILTGKYNTRPEFEKGDIRNIDPLFTEPRFSSALRIVRKLSELAEKYSRSPVQIAIAWVLSQRSVVCALTGPSKISHLEENAGGSDWEIDKSDLNELEQFFVKDDMRLEEEQKIETERILALPLPNDFSLAFQKLVYVLESLAELELMPEKEVLEFFHQILPLREKADENAIEILNDTKKQIRDYLELH